MFSGGRGAGGNERERNSGRCDQGRSRRAGFSTSRCSTSQSGGLSVKRDPVRLHDGQFAGRTLHDSKTHLQHCGQRVDDVPGLSRASQIAAQRASPTSINCASIRPPAFGISTVMRVPPCRPSAFRLSPDFGAVCIETDEYAGLTSSPGQSVVGLEGRHAALGTTAAPTTALRSVLVLWASGHREPILRNA